MFRLHGPTVVCVRADGGIWGTASDAWEESVALDARRRGPRPRRKKKGGGAIQVGIASSREEASSSCFDCARPAAVAWEDFLVRTGGVGGKEAFNFLASWQKRMLLIFWCTVCRFITHARCCLKTPCHATHLLPFSIAPAYSLNKSMQQAERSKSMRMVVPKPFGKISVINHPSAPGLLHPAVSS